MVRRKSSQRRRFLHQLRMIDNSHWKAIYVTKASILVAFVFLLLIGRFKNEGIT